MHRRYNCGVFWIGLIAALCGCGNPSNPSVSQQHQAAIRMIKASEGRLAPVYAPLADQIVKEYQLAQHTGVGIDLGSGPGTLIIELGKRTKMHWINADINPYFFSYFFSQAQKKGLTGRVSAIQADAQQLPFQDNFADIIVSRGSYHFWDDKTRAFAEIYRVLKPGGLAFIGRGFAADMPLEIARKIRKNQQGMNYDVEEKARELREIMRELDITGYKIRIPENTAGINYGIWIEINKPNGTAI
jgi:SAM-dependent methyltransferase